MLHKDRKFEVEPTAGMKFPVLALIGGVIVDSEPPWKSQQMRSECGFIGVIERNNVGSMISLVSARRHRSVRF